MKSRLDPVGVAVIGAGRWGDRHAAAYRALPGAHLVAVCDTDLDRARAIASHYGALRTYSSVEQVLADAEVSAVSIVLPDHLHHDATVACAAAGRHVLIEKPLATSLVESESIAATVRAYGVVAMVNFTNRWNPPLRMAKDYLATRQFGEPRYAYVRMNNTLSVPTQWLSEPSETSVLWWIGSHAIDLVRWFFSDEVESVSATSGSGVLMEAGIAAADFYVAMCRLTRGGVAVIENNWTIPDAWPGHVDVKVEIVSDAATISVDPYHHRAVEVFGSMGVGAADNLSGHGALERPDLFYDHHTGGSLHGAMPEAVRHFVDCVRTQSVPDVTLQDGIEVARVIEAVEQAAAESTTVRLQRKSGSAPSEGSEN